MSIFVTVHSLSSCVILCHNVSLSQCVTVCHGGSLTMTDSDTLFLCHSVSLGVVIFCSMFLRVIVCHSVPQCVSMSQFDTCDIVYYCVTVFRHVVSLAALHQPGVCPCHQSTA